MVLRVVRGGKISRKVRPAYGLRLTVVRALALFLAHVTSSPAPYHRAYRKLRMLSVTYAPPLLHNLICNVNLRSISCFNLSSQSSSRLHRIFTIYLQYPTAIRVDRTSICPVSFCGALERERAAAPVSI